MPSPLVNLKPSAKALARKPALITSEVRLLDGTGPAAVAMILDQLGADPVMFSPVMP